MKRNDANLMEKIVALAKRRGFIYPGSEIYGGLAGTWDYGPLGVQLKNNIKNEWWRTMVQLRDDVVGVDSAIMMNPKVWEASGHVESFTDPLVECKVCHERFLADDKEAQIEHENSHREKVSWTSPQRFNLLVEAYLGVLEARKTKIYLRGEITQGVYVNYKNIQDSNPQKISFGIAQIGKAFRNEITPGNFTYRSREFEQMELQYFIKPQEKESQRWFEYWKQERMKWYVGLGIDQKNLRFRDHTATERAHYARAATDIEYNSSFGWREFEGIHHRGDWDLARHAKFSGADLRYYEAELKERFTPWVIETSGGVDRAALFFLTEAYHQEKERVVLKLHPKLAPYKVAIFPLLANKEKLVEKARDIYAKLQKNFFVAWDERGNIGKRYFAQDEIGTPWCVTVDFQTLEDDTVTVRDRDSTKQERIKSSALINYFSEKLKNF